MSPLTDKTIIALSPGVAGSRGGWSELARKSKLSASHVSRIMRGGGCSAATFAAVADAAGVSMDQLRQYITMRNSVTEG